VTDFCEWCWLALFVEVDALFWTGVVHVVGSIL
jgi:hypothetical protein